MKLHATVAAILFSTLLSAASAADTSWKEKAEKALALKVTFDFSDTSCGEAISFFAQISKLNILADLDVEGGGPANMTLNCKDARLNEALDKVCALSKLEWTLVDEAVFVFPKGKYTLKPKPLPPPLTEEALKLLQQALPDLSSAEFEIREKASAAIKSLGSATVPRIQQALKTETDAEARERLTAISKSFETLTLFEPTPELNLPLEKLNRKLTFEFVDQTLEDATAFFNQFSRMKITCDKEVMNRPVTMRVHDMEISVALKWIARLTHTRLALEGDSLKLTAASTAEKK